MTVLLTASSVLIAATPPLLDTFPQVSRSNTNMGWEAFVIWTFCTPSVRLPVSKPPRDAFWVVMNTQGASKSAWVTVCGPEALVTVCVVLLLLLLLGG